MKPVRALLLPLILALPLPSWAGPAGDALGSCLADSTTGKDRKDLARWIFVALAAHPEIKALGNVSADARVDADQTMAALFTTLLTDRCKAQARTAVQQEGSGGVVAGFRTLGELAMKELMSNPDVATSLSGYERYIDRAKLDATFGRP